MMSTIKPIDVSDACRAVKSKGYLETALKMKSLAGQVFRYAVQTAKAERDVTQDLKGTLKKPPTKHYPAIIDPVEFGQMLRSIDDYHEERGLVSVQFEWLDFFKSCHKLRVILLSS